MQLWNSFVQWVTTNVGWHYVAAAGVVFLAILISGIIAASVGRGSTKRAIALADRESRVSTVAALISSARKATVWNTLPAPEQSHMEHLISEADIRLRLLPVAGASLAADWAAHEIADMQKNAISFSFQAEQSMFAFRDRLVEWQSHPSRAKRLFKNDLDAWAYESSLTDQDLIHQQQAWAAQQDDTTSSLDMFTAEPVGSGAK